MIKRVLDWGGEGSLGYTVYRQDSTFSGIIFRGGSWAKPSKRALSAHCFLLNGTLIFVVFYTIYVSAPFEFSKKLKIKNLHYFSLIQEDKYYFESALSTLTPRAGTLASTNYMKII